MRVLPGVLALLAATQAPPAEPTQRDLLEAVERHLKAVHETAGPAMACVVVSRSDQYPKPATPPDYPGRLGGFDPTAVAKTNPALARRLDLADFRGIPDHESAAGVVIDPAGLILTNFHTIEGATKVYVHLPGGKGSYADVHAADARADLAVLKLLTSPADLKAVKLADARLQVLKAGPPTLFAGKLVTVLAFQPATGFAPDRPGGTVTALTNIQLPRENPGVVEQPQSVYRYAPLLEFEARSAPAVSGAAVMSLDGELVGLTSTVAVVAGGDNGRAYALPIDASTRRVIETLARGEEVEYGLLGVVYDRTAPGGGIVISYVTPRSPADGRLGAGDTIVRINGHPMRNFYDLLYHVGYTLAGNRLTLTVRGVDGNERPVDLTVAKYRHDGAFVAANRPAPVFGLRVDWGSVLAQVLDRTAVVPPGVSVRELVPDSPAATKFKELGDNTRWLITHANGTPTPTPAAFYQAARNQMGVRLTVIDPADRTARPRAVTLP